MGSEMCIRDRTRLGGADYLLTVEDIDAEEMEAWIFKQTGTDGEEVCYQTIDDENELKAVSGIFKELLDDCDFEL